MTEEVGVAAVMLEAVAVMLEAVAGLPPCWSRYCHRRLRVTSQMRSKAGILGFSFRAFSISATEFEPHRTVCTARVETTLPPRRPGAEGINYSARHARIFADSNLEAGLMGLLGNLRSAGMKADTMRDKS